MLYVTKLHDQVESTLVKLSRLADKRLTKLESILQFKGFKEECEKVSRFQFFRISHLSRLDIQFIHISHYNWFGCRFDVKVFIFPLLIV